MKKKKLLTALLLMSFLVLSSQKVFAQTFVGEHFFVNDGGCTNKRGFLSKDDVWLNYNGGILTNDESIFNDGRFSNSIPEDNADKIPGINRNSTINNKGTITNLRTIENYGYGMFNNKGTITNLGTIENYGYGMFNNKGTITNLGTIENYGYGMFNNEGTIYNKGTIKNFENGTIENYGKIIGHGQNALNNIGGTIINWNYIEGLNIESSGGIIVNELSGIIRNFDAHTVLGSDYENYTGALTANAGTIIDNRGTILSKVVLNDSSVLQNSGLLTGSYIKSDDETGIVWNTASGILESSKIGQGSKFYNSGKLKGKNFVDRNGSFIQEYGVASDFDKDAILESSGFTGEMNGIIEDLSGGDNSVGHVLLEGGAPFTTDLSTATGQTDKYNFKKYFSFAEFRLEDFNPLPDIKVSHNFIPYEELKENLGIMENNGILTFGDDAYKDHKFLSPLRWMNAKAVDEYGEYTNGGILIGPTGNSYKDFNPSVMAAPIAAQIGGYLTQLNSYDEAFRNMDMYMLMTQKERQAIKLRNKYAISDTNRLSFDPTGTVYDDKAVWFRPFATFENVKLKGGPKVSNVAYGSYFGGESEMYDLGNGWDGMYGVYVGYNGSHQTYDGIGIYQNGGTLGLVGMAYKGNFFTGLTVNAGANIAEADTYYGHDNFNLLMAGIANKTGYNWELAGGKFIIQPNLVTSYSFVNTFDYKNSAGINVDSDPLHAIQVEPGLKFIGNLKNGWQPYAGVSVVWNIMDKTKFHASDATLPELSVKPFVKYGIGIRKTWGERLTGFFQTFFTSGGRNGIGLQAGFRITLGKGGKSISKGSVPELPKTELKLSDER